MRYWTNTIALTAVAAVSLVFAVPAAGAENDLTDRDVTLAVESELILDDAVPWHRIDVSTENGIVTLSGSVDSYFTKWDAREAAESVKGVRAVINELDVNPSPRRDAQIRSDVFTALVADPVTESFDVTVDVEDGLVTLRGEVDSYTEKMVAEEVAARVRGVSHVTNLLTYKLDADRVDSEIADDIRYRLKSDASIDSGLISVSVKNGHVKLSGSVTSAAEKSEAESRTRFVLGVEDVTNNLVVEWWRNDETSDWSGGWSDKDAQIAIQRGLIANPRVQLFDVVTTVDDGVATLTGTVDNLQAKLAAEEEARDVLGIWRVKNYIRVRPDEDRPDSDIASDIRAALHRSAYVDRYDISVSVYNGKAYLSGEVDSWFMKNQAEQAAAGVEGLVEIQNNLRADDEYPVASDREIKEDIVSQLWWSPYVDSDDITVEVNSGVASLFGTVDDWRELMAAKENAREGGATSVISKLEVRNGFSSS